MKATPVQEQKLRGKKMSQHFIKRIQTEWSRNPINGFFNVEAKEACYFFFGNLLDQLFSGSWRSFNF